MTEWISIPFIEEEVNFIRIAFPGYSTVEAIKLAALSEAGQRVRKICEAEKLLRDYRSYELVAEPDKAVPTKATARPLPISQKREAEIEAKSRELRKKMNAEDEARHRQLDTNAEIRPSPIRQLAPGRFQKCREEEAMTNEEYRTRMDQNVQAMGMFGTLTEHITDAELDHMLRTCALGESVGFILGLIYIARQGV